MDRLDYLRRDSFFSGVQEGVVGQDRIIKMLNVCEGELVVDEKGIYSIEKFLIARRLMYWQVYLHKTVVAAESVLIKAMERAFELASKGVELFASPALKFFLYEQPKASNFFTNKEGIQFYTQLDDDDIMTSIKVWCHHEDLILRELCLMLRDRQLPRIVFSNEPFEEELLQNYRSVLLTQKDIKATETDYFIYTDSVKNRAYNLDHFHINILYKDGTLMDIAKASDQYNIETLARSVTKYFLCYPKYIQSKK
jgi:HD superfamily phosphohydrolase